ncbi:MAG: cation-binding protein [Homoserinimonas sp.]|nr:cation-binding protein [Homoserinimonas sp.]
MRSVAVQTDRELGGSASVLVRQKRDHVRLNELLGRLEVSAGAEQQHLLLKVYRLVFPHAFAEESVLWPVMRRMLPDGGTLTREVEREHQEVNELVTELEHIRPGDARRDEILDRLIDVLREDVRDEEDVLLPRLQSVLRPRQLQALGLAWEGVRRVAPTRAHPIVSRRPPGNVVAALPLTAVDRVRDRIDARLLTGLPSDSRLPRLSSVLTRLSHRIELLPVMRRGEDSSTRSSRRLPRLVRFPYVLKGAAGVAAFALLVLVVGGRSVSGARRGDR